MQKEEIKETITRNGKRYWLDAVFTKNDPYADALTKELRDKGWDVQTIIKGNKRAVYSGSLKAEYIRKVKKEKEKEKKGIISKWVMKRRIKHG